MAATNGGDIPREMWHKTLEHLSSDPESLFRAGQVSKAIRQEASDRQLWSKHRKSWSPEYCGSLRTGKDGKDFRMLYRRWHHGKPFEEDLIDTYGHQPNLVPAHLEWDHELGRIARVKAIKLSQAGALVAWSVGMDGALLRTDVTTCKTRRWFTPENDHGFSCLDVLNADGRVFTGGRNFICWDPRQGLYGHISNRQPFRLDYCEATQRRSISVTAIISEESSGQPMVLTGGEGGDVCLWDLRTNQILTRYEHQVHYQYDSINCLALEPRRGTLIGGGLGGLYFWNFNTGDPWGGTFFHDPLEQLTFDVKSIAVGTERMIVGGYHGVFEWAIPDPPAGVTKQLQGVLAVPRYPLVFPRVFDSHCPLTQAMQGVGEGPAGILAGTADGSIGMWKSQNNLEQAQQQCDYLTLRSYLSGPRPHVAPEHLQAPIMWSNLESRNGDWEVTCLAATDEIVVNGFSNGKIRIARMKEQF